MAFLSVIVAALAGYAVGAAWYMTLAKPWMAAAGISQGEDGRPEGQATLSYALSLLAMILVSGMMRHVFALSGIDTAASGFVSGLGIGLFFISPWIMINNSYCNRPFRLTVIDGGYATLGCAVIGLVLTFF